LVTVATTVFFLPLAALAASRMTWALPGRKLSQRLVWGAVVWLYLLLIPAILLGIVFGGSLNLYFPLFFFAGIVILGLSVYHIARNPPKFGRPQLQAVDWLVLAAIAVFASLYALGEIGEPIIFNWDSLAVYLPYAQGIVTTGGVMQNPYFPANPSVYASIPVGLPIVFAAILDVLGPVMRLVPLLYLSVACVSIYAMVDLFYGKRILSLLAVLVFLSIPGIFMLTTMEGLLLDLPYIAYTCAALYFIFAYLEYHDSKQLIWACMALQLGMLTKASGLPIMSAFLGIVVAGLGFGKSSTRHAILFTFTIFAFLFGWVAYFFNVQDIIVVLPSILAILMVTKNMNLTTLRRRDFVVVVSSLGVGAAYYVKNFIVSRVFTTEFFLTGTFVPTQFWPEFMRVVHDTPSLSSYFFSNLYFAGALEKAPLAIFDSLVGLYSSGLVTSMILVPASLGLGALIWKSYRGDTKVKPFFLLLLVTFSTWVFLFGGNFQSWEYRRLTYFSPYLTILVVEGIVLLSRRIGSLYPIAISFVAFISLSWSYLWNFMIPSPRIVAGNFATASVASIQDVNVFAAIFVSCVALAVIAARWRSYWNLKIPIIATSLLVIIIFAAVGNSLVAAGGINPQSSDKLGSIAPYNQPLGLGYQGMADFFSNLHTNSTVVVFGLGYLPYTSGTRIIEMEDFYSYPFMLPILNQTNPNELLRMLRARGITYFVIPKGSFASVDGGAVRLAEFMSANFLLFRIVGTFTQVGQTAEGIIYHLGANYSLDSMNWSSGTDVNLIPEAKGLGSVNVSVGSISFSGPALPSYANWSGLVITASSSWNYSKFGWLLSTVQTSAKGSGETNLEVDLLDTSGTSIGFQYNIPSSSNESVLIPIGANASSGTIPFLVRQLPKVGQFNFAQVKSIVFLTMGDAPSSELNLTVGASYLSSK
jgi:Dolichyl-phosphate-mannose-protein mannosyltransferase